MQGSVLELFLVLVQLVWWGGNTLGDTGVKDSNVCQFANIVWTASMAASWESHMMLGTSLSFSNKKCMAWVILSSAVTWGCVRYSWKYFAVSLISIDLVLLCIYWMKR